MNIVGCYNLTEAKSREVCTVLPDKELFLKNRPTLATKRSVWPSSTLKYVNSGVSLVAIGYLDGQIWVRKLTNFDHVCVTKANICVPDHMTQTPRFFSLGCLRCNQSWPRYFNV